MTSLRISLLVLAAALVAFGAPFAVYGALRLAPHAASIPLHVASLSFNR